MNYRIELTASASADLAYFRASERKEIVQAMRAQLTYAPLTETANRKTLRPNTVLAPWELRVGRFRVFYEVVVEESVVRVLAVGHKIHNQLFIRGEEVHL